MKKKKRKRIIITLAALLLAAIGLTVWANVSVSRWANGRCFDDLGEIPAQRVALLLGTTKNTRQGAVNPYFTNRVEAAAELYHNGKVQKILVSGDNCRDGYNEPADMCAALLALGVADSDIVLDYAGFRTYDSMVRAQKVFGQYTLTVVSQQWHNERALYIAHSIGIEAVAYNAADVQNRPTALKLCLREWLARTKMALDLIFPHNPHFLGEPIKK